MSLKIRCPVERRVPNRQRREGGRRLLFLRKPRSGDALADRFPVPYNSRRLSTFTVLPAIPQPVPLLSCGRLDTRSHTMEATQERVELVPISEIVTSKNIRTTFDK